MRYCKNCILPDTRPGIRLNEEGICGGCSGHGIKGTQIDWDQRRRDFERVVERVKGLGKGYDCLIPVSGGKDSTWQVVRCLEYGLNPLAVTWKTPARTELGAQNLDNLINLGVDHIDYQVNPKVERKFMLAALERFGATAVPMHMALFSMTLRIAVKFGIPLVVWGENSALEYGGSTEAQIGFKLDSNWLRQYGVTHGTTAKDWISDELTEKELTPYFCPSDEELEEAGVQAVFLGSFFEWDPEMTLRVARENGFRVREAGPKTGYYNYADIDCDFISIHHFLKWYKFGMTRTWDNLSLEIRHGRMTREQAIEILRNRGNETPHEDIAKFCEWVGISQERFYEIIEPYRNRDLWKQTEGGWTIPGFLIPDWSWN